MTVDWTPWLTITEEQQQKLWADYRATIGHEINLANLNRWRRLDLALRHPFTWREKVRA